MSYSDWVFDLDNTLYPASSNLFSQIHRRMQIFIAEALKLDLDSAFELQGRYYRTYGTTLSGLMREHDLPPEEFLAFVHDIDHSVLEPAPRLDAALAKLPGRKLIFTNGSCRHAEKVLERLGLSHHFSAIFDIKSADYVPKPAIETYRRLLTEFSVNAGKAVMFEDLAHNLAAASELGMTTVWVRQQNHPDGDLAAVPAPAFVDHVTDDLADWLEAAVEI
jgi:putative hydrolase of the HAD superfamily